MFKIEVTSKVVTKEVTSRKTGEIFRIPEQECWAHLPGEQYPVKIVRPVGKGAKELAAGVYALSASSFYADRYGNLGIRAQFDVVPWVEPVKKAA